MDGWSHVVVVIMVVGGLAVLNRIYQHSQQEEADVRREHDALMQDVTALQLKIRHNQITLPPVIPAANPFLRLSHEGGTGDGTATDRKRYAMIRARGLVSCPVPKPRPDPGLSHPIRR